MCAGEKGFATSSYYLIKTAPMNNARVWRLLQIDYYRLAIFCMLIYACMHACTLPVFFMRRLVFHWYIAAAALGGMKNGCDELFFGWRRSGSWGVLHERVKSGGIAQW